MFPCQVPNQKGGPRIAIARLPYTAGVGHDANSIIKGKPFARRIPEIAPVKKRWQVGVAKEANAWTGISQQIVRSTDYFAAPDQIVVSITW